MDELEALGIGQNVIVVPDGSSRRAPSLRIHTDWRPCTCQVSGASGMPPTNAVSSSMPTSVLLRMELGAGAHAGPSGRFAHLDYEAEVYAWVLETVGRSAVR